MAISNIDWDKYFTSLDYKANVDANNFSKPGKNNLTTFGMPSDKYIDLPATDGYVYTAPENGYIFVRRTITNTWIEVQVRSGTGAYYDCVSQHSGGNTLFVPISKGHKVTFILRQVQAASDDHTRFIYAQGNQPQN